jgi:hypothetical protein
MPIQISWMTPDKTILVNTYKGAWTTAEVAQAVDANKVLVDEIGHPVPLILDMRQAGTAPPSLLTISTKVDKELTPLVTMIILVGASGYVRTISNLFRRVVPKTLERIHFADTLDEAVALVSAAGE